MKSLTRFLIILLLLSVNELIAQTPFGVSYQAVLRDSDGKALNNQNTTLKMNLTNSDGTLVYYTENHAVTTNAFGLATLIVGSGTDATGVYADVPWKDGNIYLRVDLKLEGQTAFTQFERQKLQAVPYALYAADGLTLKWQGSLTSAPSSPAINYAYYNTVDKKSYIYDGDSWEILTQDGINGTDGVQGNPGADGTDGISILWAGSSDVPPATALNKAYYDTGDKTSYIWDGNSWEILAKDGLDGAQGNPGLDGINGVDGINGADGISILWAGSLAEAPTTALNKAYYNTADKTSYIWDGDSWEILSKDGLDGAQGPEGPLVAGTLGQTLSHNGTGWIANGNIMVTDTSVNVHPVADHNVEQPIFAVFNSSGQVVFAVYENGVKSFVGSASSKGTKGGFAVGGLTNKTKAPVDYLFITPDSARIYIDNSLSTKGAKGGFAVGGLTNQSKGSVEFFRITRDSTRLYIDETYATKGAKGGFAVGGLTNQSKSGSSNFFTVTKDSTYITNTILSEGDMYIAGTVSTTVGMTETPLTDEDNNTYKTLKIGTQVWMAENLKTTRYADSTAIPVDSILVYNNSVDLDTLNVYGRLYSFNSIKSPLGVCPTGWHLPTAIEWDELFAFVGGQYYTSNTKEIGVKLSESGFQGSGGYWLNQSGLFYPDNSTGFSARPGGVAESSAQWMSYGMGSNASFWVNETGTPQLVRIDGLDGTTIIQEGTSMAAYSVRCIKD